MRPAPLLLLAYLRRRPGLLFQSRVLGFKPDIDLFVRDERDVAIVELVLASVEEWLQARGTWGAALLAGPVANRSFTLADSSRDFGRPTTRARRQGVRPGR